MGMMPAEWAGRLLQQHKQTFSTRAWLANRRLMVFEVKGLVTPEDGLALVRQLGAHVQRHRPQTILADYHAACMAADPRTMVAKVKDGDRAAHFLNPRIAAAVLVTPAELPLWEEFCGLMGMRAGVLRGAFSDADAALTWLEVQERALRPRGR